MSFTFITALYETTRVHYDKRSFAEYRQWFENTLKIPVPMVIYTEEKNRDIVEKSRGSLPTKVFYTSLQEVPFYYTKGKVEEIIQKSRLDPTTNIYKLLQRYPHNLEFNCSDYIPIVNSKFEWIKQAIEQNYFNTDMFFWIDAGLSRFFHFDLSKYHFNTELINKIHTTNKIFLQIGKPKEYMDALNNKINMDDYIGSCTNFIMAGFLGGNKGIMYEICNMGSKLYFEEGLNKNRVDNEQAFFGYILQKYKNDIIAIEPHRYVDCHIYYMFCNQTI